MNTKRVLLLTLIAFALLAPPGCSASKDRKKKPEILSLTPNVGIEGEVVVITGKRFSKKLLRNRVTFNGVEATLLLAKKDSLTVLVPDGADTGPVQVFRGRKASNTLPFTVLKIPTITRLIPNSGPEGLLVTIQGRYFGPTPPENLIRFGGVQTPTLTASTTELTAFVPLGAVSGDVTVEVGPDTSNGVFFEVTTPHLFDVQPFFGPTDAAVVLTGEKFSPVPDENIVRFNGVQTPVTFASTFGNSLSTVVPMDTRSGPVTVEVMGGRGISEGLPFCVEDPPPVPPAIAGFSPPGGAVMDNIVINGNGFSANPTDNEVRFSGTLATVVAASTGSLTVEVPDGAVSGPITVEVAGRTATSTPFAVSTPPPPPPVIISVELPIGSEGDAVLVRGADFSPVASNNRVFFDGAEARVVGAAPEGLLVIAPFSQSGPVTVEVGSQMSVNSGQFDYLPSPPPAQPATFQCFGQTLDTSSTSVVFVVDISGTLNWTYGTFFNRFGAQVINGTRLQLVQDRLAAAIDGLQGGFRFNVVAYDCTPFSWQPTMQDATPGNKSSAIAFLNGLAPSGSSDTGLGGSFALDLDRENRTMVLVSDGSPTCGPTSQAAHLCEVLTANTQGAQVHTFAVQGFGTFVTFMQDMASLTGGSYGVAQ